MSEDRRLAVLRAIVQDYVADLRAGRLQGAASSATTSASRAATVRNDMAALEEEGLIAAAAHRAGRVPDRCRATALFVDRLSAVKPLSAGRAPGDRARSSRGPSTSTTSSTAPCGCSPR